MAEKKEDQPGLPIPAKETPAPVTEDKIPQGYTEDEWLQLSDAEKEGIRDMVESPEEKEEEKETLTEDQLRAITGEEKPKEDKPKEEKPKEEAKPPEPEKPKEETKAPVPETKPPEGETKAPPDGTKAPSSVTIPTDDELLKFNPVVDDSELKVEDKVSADIKTKLDELETKFDAGDIDRKQYETDRDALNRQIVRAQIRAEDAERAKIGFNKIQGEFFKARPEYLEKEGEAWTVKADILFGALDKASAVLLKRGYRHDMRLLIDADKMVKETLGIKPASPAKPAAENKEEKPPAKLPDIKTLTDVPSAAANLAEGPGAQLDKLKGEAFEEYLETMAEKYPAAYKRYVEGAT
jgi:hypothetical protein